MALGIFDSFSETAMRNACRSYLSAKRRRKQKEVAGSEAVQYVIDTHTQRHPTGLADWFGLHADAKMKWHRQASPIDVRCALWGDFSIRFVLSHSTIYSSTNLFFSNAIISSSRILQSSLDMALLSTERKSASC